MIKYKRNPIKESTGGARMSNYENPYYDEATVERVLDHYKRYMKKDSTVRKVAKKSGYSRCTVYRDLVEKLPKVNSEYARKAIKKLESNGNESLSRATMAASVKNRKHKSFKKDTV